MSTVVFIGYLNQEEGVTEQELGLVVLQLRITELFASMVVFTKNTELYGSCTMVLYLVTLMSIILITTKLTIVLKTFNALAVKLI